MLCAAGAVLETSLAFETEATAPLIDGGPRDVETAGDLGLGVASIDEFDHAASAQGSEWGVKMDQEGLRSVGDLTTFTETDGPLSVS